MISKEVLRRKLKDIKEFKMTIKRCNSCGEPFSDRKSGYARFCSERCKNRYYDLLDKTKNSDNQIEKDLKLKQRAESDDLRRRKGID